VDLDAFVGARRPEWERLQRLVSRRRPLSGPEVDALVRLYQRTATDLSVVRTRQPDVALIGRLSGLVARARSAVTSPQPATWHAAAAFLAVRFPAAVYRMRRWWLGTAAVTLAVSFVVGGWIATHPEVRDAIASPAEIRSLTAPGGEFESYYSSAPAASFAAHVWTNNALVTAAGLTLGVFLGLPVLYLLLANAVNIGVDGGLMTWAGRADVFLTLLVPHGLLELTAMFIGTGAGLRLGWTIIDPGPRRRSEALAAEGRTTLGLVFGLVGMLAVSGFIEAFVTPSPLPPAVRIAIGVGVELLFLAYIWTCGRRAVRHGEGGDIDAADRPDSTPVTA